MKTITLTIILSPTSTQYTAIIMNIIMKIKPYKRVLIVLKRHNPNGLMG
jgi:hypothetical protein